MLFKGVLVDEGAVAGMAGDAHSGWLLNSKTLCKEEGKDIGIFGSFNSFYQSTHFVAGAFFHACGQYSSTRRDESFWKPPCGRIVKFSWLVYHM